MAQSNDALAENPFALDSESEVPVGTQLSWRLRALISTGRLPAGDRLPSFRNLAEWAGVNVNTVRAVYANLEAEGLVISSQGRGTFVSEGVVAAPALEEIAAAALRQARIAGLSPHDLATVTLACASVGEEAEDGQLAQPPPQPHGDADPSDLLDASEVIEVRHELRRQIARLELELGSYTRHLPSESSTANRFAKPHIAGVEELERTRDRLIANLSEAQQQAEEQARRIGRDRARRREFLDAPEQPLSPSPVEGPLERAMGRWRRR